MFDKYNIKGLKELLVDEVKSSIENNYSPDGVELDKDIRSLIYNLNICGHKTYFSCSSHPIENKYVGYIAFEYNKRTFELLMYVLDKLDTEFYSLDLRIDICKYKANIVNIDKFLAFRYKAKTVEDYDKLLLVFGYLEYLVKYNIL